MATSWRADDLGLGRPATRLAAPEPGWRTEADVVVVGSGIAGLTAALRAREHGRVVLVTKQLLDDGSTRWAQGGIAAALGPGDTPDQHLDDTLEAGAGLCDEPAVRVLVDEGPEAVRELVALGAHFDTDPVGALALTREGGHHRDRIAHAGGDATGAEIQRALVAALRAAPEVEILEHAFVLDLLLDASGGAAGVSLHVLGEGVRDGVGAVHAPAVVLATGGLGQVFDATTNPTVATGDGVAVALRAGAVVRDLEFVQFHPTVLWLGPSARGQQPLVSEAVRGEGAFLVDSRGRRVTEGVHPLGDLAPRDVVAKAIMRAMLETGEPHVWLDARHLGEDFWHRRFPTILGVCRSYGIDPVTMLLPVAPACHYASGGVATDLEGRTSVPGLYACGETACSGVHGANRLASNSLLEGLVFARRIAAALPERLGATRREPVPVTGAGGAPTASSGVPRLQEVMTRGVGVLRDHEGLAAAAAALGALHSDTGTARVEDWRATNLLTVAEALVLAASIRTETRGSHWRDDHPERDDAAWSGHVDLTLGDDGLRARWTPRGVV